MISAAIRFFGRDTCGVRAVRKLFRFVLLYPLTLVGGALLLWLGTGLLSAGPATVAPTTTTASSSRSTSSAGIVLTSGGKSGGPKLQLPRIGGGGGSSSGGGKSGHNSNSGSSNSSSHNSNSGNSKSSHNSNSGGGSHFGSSNSGGNNSTGKSTSTGRSSSSSKSTNNSSTSAGTAAGRRVDGSAIAKQVKTQISDRFSSIKRSEKSSGQSGNSSSTTENRVSTNTSVSTSSGSSPSLSDSEKVAIAKYVLKKLVEKRRGTNSGGPAPSAPAAPSVSSSSAQPDTKTAIAKKLKKSGHLTPGTANSGSPRPTGGRTGTPQPTTGQTTSPKVMSGHTPAPQPTNGRHPGVAAGQPVAAAPAAPAAAARPAATARCSSIGGGAKQCRVASGSGANKKVQTCVRKAGRGCEGGLLVSTRNAAGQEAGARVYFKPNGQAVVRTRETTPAGTSTATSVGKRGNSGRMISTPAAGSTCAVHGARGCHTTVKTVTDPATPATTPAVGKATCGRGAGAGSSCTSRISPVGDPSCSSSGAQCTTRIVRTDPRTESVTTGGARCAQHANGNCGTVTHIRDASSACNGRGGHTYCQTDAVGEPGATTGACTQTSGRCRVTSDLRGRNRTANTGGTTPNGHPGTTTLPGTTRDNPRSGCTSSGSKSTCDTRAAALGGTPAVGYCANLLGGSCNSSASQQHGSACNANGPMIHCGTSSARTAGSKNSCTNSHARCRDEIDKTAGTQTSNCTAATSHARCSTRSTGRSIAPLDPPPGDPLEPTAADLGAASDPRVLNAARGKKKGPVTVDQAQTKIARLQGHTARASENLDRLAPQGDAVNAFAEVLNNKNKPRNRGNDPMTAAQSKAFDTFNTNHAIKVDHQVTNYDKAHAALRNIDVALAQASGDPTFAAKVTAADTKVDKTLAALNATPDPKTAKQAKTQARRAAAYQKALTNYNKVIDSPQRIPGTALPGYHLPSSGADDVTVPMTGASRLGAYQNYHGEFEDVFHTLTPDELATQAASEPLDQALVRLRQEQADTDAQAARDQAAADAQAAAEAPAEDAPVVEAPADESQPADAH